MLYNIKIGIPPFFSVWLTDTIVRAFNFWRTSWWGNNGRKKTCNIKIKLDYASYLGY